MGRVSNAMRAIIAPPPLASDERSPEEYATHLQEIVAYYREHDPEGWVAIERCPLMHGIETIAAKLRALR